MTDSRSSQLSHDVVANNGDSSAPVNESASTPRAAEPACDDPTVAATDQRAVLSTGQTERESDSHSSDRSAGSAELPAYGPAADNQKTVISTRPPPDAEPAPMPRGIGPAVICEMLKGQRLGHFELEEFVGGGGMGAVFRARDTLLNRTVAVKVLSREHGGDHDNVRRFRNEAQSAARLDHRNIARAYFVGEDDGWHYIVFEFVDGVNVRDLVARDGPLSIIDAVRYTLQVAEALAHAHNRDVVHRDIKPSNLLIAASGDVKIVDMGLARLHQVEASNDDLTASGVTLGTFDFISPEQARDPRTADVRSDLYSLGCTLYYMLCGRPPFPEGTALQKLLRHSSDEPPDVRIFRPDAPEELVDILQRLLAKAPEHRFQEPSELIGELLLLAEQLGIDEASAAVLWVSRNEGRLAGWRLHLPWIAPVVLLAVLLVLADRYWFGSKGEDSLPQLVVPAARTVASRVNGSAGGESPAPAAAPGEGDSVDGSSRSAAASSSEGQAAPIGIGKPVGVGKAGAWPPANDVRDSLVWPWQLAAAGADSPPAALPPTGAASDPVGEPSAGETKVKETPGAGLTEPPPASAEIDWDRVETVYVGQPLPTELPANAARLESFDVAINRLATASLPRLAEIVLRENMIEASPFALSGRSLTIRADKGFRPVLSFGAGGGSRVADSALRSGPMIRIAGGQVAFQGVHFHYAYDTSRSQPSSLFELTRAERVTLTDCTLTIKASLPYEGQLAFFRIRPALVDKSKMMRDARGDAVSPVDLRLENCIARGEADFVRFTETLYPLSLTWNNGLLVTSGRLVDTPADTRTIRPDPGMVQLVLNHLTARADSGMCRLQIGEQDPNQLPRLDIHCKKSILISGGDGATLIEQRGRASINMLRSTLEVHEETKNKNFYEGIKLFWRLHGADDSSEYDWARWRKERMASESFSYQDKVVWDSPPPTDLPLWRHRKEHYVLDEKNPYARSRIAGESDAGMMPTKLPALPIISAEAAAGKTTADSSDDETPEPVEAPAGG